MFHRGAFAWSRNEIGELGSVEMGGAFAKGQKYERNKLPQAPYQRKAEAKKELNEIVKGETPKDGKLLLAENLSMLGNPKRRQRLSHFLQDLSLANSMKAV